MLCFGGSFNPVHRAHLACSAAAARAAGFDRVRLILAARPPLKDDRSAIASVEDRLSMLRLAAADAAAPTEAAMRDVTYLIDDRETRRPGPSYTIDTVHELLAEGERVDWLIGADQLLWLPRWHRVDELLAAARFWVMARPGYAIDWPAMPSVVRGLADRVVIVPQMDVSATDIRRGLREGTSIAHLVTPSVDRYLREHRLYADSGALIDPSRNDDP
ncbi:MAG TPA: nicotinate (nicotinamide) nucleotide adenylyltransferase [Tepidisphaeraceae bacterium]|jgi:nicotinate-nucleotide adenylyltransferase